MKLPTNDRRLATPSPHILGSNWVTRTQGKSVKVTRRGREGGESNSEREREREREREKGRERERKRERG